MSEGAYTITGARWRFNAGGILSALPDVALATTFLLTWIRPEFLGIQRVRFLLMVVLLEFIIIHSSAFLGNVLASDLDKGKKTLGLLGLGAFYTIFAGAFSLVNKSWWPVTSFWMLMLNKFLFLFTRAVPSEEEKAAWASGWATNVLFYLGATFATTLLPIPRLGVTSAVQKQFHLPGSGLWISEPWRVLALGFLYFSAVSIVEITGFQLKARRNA